MKYILPNRPNTISGDNPGGERGCGNPDSLTVMKLAQISAVKDEWARKNTQGIEPMCCQSGF